MNVYSRKKQGLLLLCLFISLFCHAKPFAIDRFYTMVWDSPSKNALESMPLGGGDIGCNVWVESGEIFLYMQRSGCFDETGEYLKLGRIRLSLSPNPLENHSHFRQELKLKDGYITIRSQNKTVNVKLKVWVDLFTHSIHFSIESSKPIQVKASYENWRTDDRLLSNQKRGRFGCFGLEGFPGEVVKKKDRIVHSGNTVLFYHRNGDHPLSPEVMIEQQGLTPYKDQITNNIANLTFGGIMAGKNFIPAGESQGVYCGTSFRAYHLQSKSPSRKHHLFVSTHVGQSPTIEQWQQELHEQHREAESTGGNLSRNISWWNGFWQRSWIVTDPHRTDSDTLFRQMGRNYQLFRYQLGCNLYGEYPTKFNGGNFTVDPSLTDPAMTHDPDWRAWGGDVFTAQNQRLVYWPMLKSGDSDGLKSQFNLYEMGLNGAMLKVREHFGHKGAIFCEYANAAGLDFGAGWGWESGNLRRRGQEVPFGDPAATAATTYGQTVEKGIMANGSIAYHWESQVEMAYMMLEYHRFTGENIDHYMPFIKNALLFFEEHYQKRELLRNDRPVDENGKLVFYPSTSCESYRGAKNPVDLISGIAACLEALTDLKSDSLSSEDKRHFKAYLDKLPGFSYETIQGDKVLKPAESYIKYQNVECPQFYPLFPFNRFDVQSEYIPIFRNTWTHGKFPKNMVISWHQDGIFFARMGLAAEALAYNKQKLRNSPRRYPTFWGPGHDWVPDHNWGGSGMIGLQEMLLQTVGNKIYIFPAWPKGKDVYFKLHAPQNTTVEVEYLGGEVKKLHVSPIHRLKDVQILIE